MNSGNHTIIGIDVGGTKIHGGLYEVQSAKCKVQSWKSNTPLEGGRGEFFVQNEEFILLRDEFVLTKAKEGIEVVLEQVVEMIGSLRREDTVSVGVGLPGQVDHIRGLLYGTANIAYDGLLDLKDFFSSKIDLPMTFDNDAKLFTLAEFELNQKPKGIQNMLGLTLGTGLGGGIVINGVPYRGTHGFAGELGHMVVQVKSEKLKVKNGESENVALSTEDFFSYEDVIASKGKDETRGKYLGMFIRGLLNAFDPQVIALGGAISKRFDEFQGAMWEEIRKHKVEEAWKDLMIYPTQIEHPGTLGAAIVGMRLQSADPGTIPALSTSTSPSFSSQNGLSTHFVR